MYRRIAFLILTLVVVSCTPNSRSDKGDLKKDATIQIDLDRKDKLSLYDLFSRVEVIPLETNEKSLLQFQLGEPDQVVVKNNHYYFLDESQDAIFIFNYKGRFVQKFDKRGSGPGEYISLDGFVVTDKTNQLEVLSSIGRSIYCYDSLGSTFLQRRAFPSELPVIHHFYPLNSDQYVLYSMAGEGEIYVYSWKDQRYSKINYSLPEWVIDKTLFGPGRNPFYIFDNQVCFAQTYNGDIFTLSSDDNKLLPRYSWDFGDNTFKLSVLPEDKDMAYYLNLTRSLSSKYAIQFLVFKENTSYYFTRFKYKNRHIYLIYDKHAKTYLLFERFAEGGQCIPEWIDEEAIYTFVPPSMLHLVIDFSKLNEADKKRVPAIGEEDNPVIIKYIFK